MKSLESRGIQNTQVALSALMGCRQGGVLSPILLYAYMDDLLLRLSASGVGCYVGHQFTGALGYADGVALLAPPAYRSIRLC